jgi:hypothetical protein
MSGPSNPLRLSGSPDKVAGAIEKGRRRRKRNGALTAEGVVTVYTATEMFHRHADGTLERVVPDPVEANARAHLAELARATADAEAAFRRTIIDDWPNAVNAYLAWCDARRREGGYADIPYFSQTVDLILYAEVVARNRR